MPTKAEQRETAGLIPKITCPRCGELMRLARVEPDTDKAARLMFDCDCGFEYQMSERARPGA
jgi:hypothetical protein